MPAAATIFHAGTKRRTKPVGMHEPICVYAQDRLTFPCWEGPDGSRELNVAAFPIAHAERRPCRRRSSERKRCHLD